ncbi:hypothetical protein PSEUBRA_002528 [Kalmanozyma brasiliensis GHG001]|uniref:uncharacterized protein n=1 Tax=Kalmanozyma brasiliensis (strain GHG001) TaxID=1365824 RepID=UPI0028682774|nr:uncharacterized protein PSEUBRA_002528 [Kalmanozyma brasiliensis GHG001]KAF6767097.1 hypothetical protein PSEUBRA_002528 [Kalmanozyma brasiliensis GHG001]
MSAPASSAASRLPAELLAYIIELSILTSTPSPRRASSNSTHSPGSPFTTPLRATFASSHSWTASLLYVSRFFFRVARPILLRTLTLGSPTAARAFLATVPEWGMVQRAWLGNVAHLNGVDPLTLRLQEAGWYEEGSGGFVVGHAYASRSKVRRKRRVGERERRFRSVSVYWAEEQLMEEVSDSQRSSGESDDDATGTSPPPRNAQGEVAGPSRAPHQPEEQAAWQTLYSRRRRSSPTSVRGQPSNGVPTTSIVGSQAGPAEGDLDPWDMMDAQERLAALAADPTPSSFDSADTQLSPHLDISTTSNPPDTISHPPIHPPLRQRREIYAYHLTLATLEPFINPLLSSIRSLRLITLTFYPGHLLDDDKLEHTLRRILSPNECPRLETLLIRIVFDAASAGSRMRRFERTKTIAGAVDRIGDERVRVMLVNNRVGEGELVVQTGESEVSPISRKAINVTLEGWWARVLQGNHHQESHQRAAGAGERTEGQVEEAEEAKVRKERQLSDWSMFFPPSQHANPTHLVGLVQHCDPWPDCPVPIA